MRNKTFRALIGGVCLILVLVWVPFMGACAPEEEVPPAPVKPIEIKFFDVAPPESTLANTFYPWFEEIEERTDGRVEMVYYPMESLGKAPDYYDICLARTADICVTMPAVMPGRFPLMDCAQLPILFPSSEVCGCVVWELIEKYMMDTELKDVKVLFVHPTGLLQIQMATKPVHTLEDLEGVKMGCSSPIMTRTLEKLGATPTMMPVTETYTSLERGLIDGALHEFDGTWMWKFHEVTKYRTGGVNLSINMAVIAMNLDTWNSLPSDIQQIFDETTGLERSRIAGARFDASEAELRGLIEEYDKKVGNPEIYYIPETERARWVEAVSPVYDEWVNEMEAMGLPGRALFEDLLLLIEKYSK